MNFKQILKGGMTILLAASLVGCAGEPADNSQGTSNGDTIALGMLGPLEGETSVYGNAVKNGADMAIQEMNEAGITIDGKTLKLVAYDTKGDNTEATNAYNKLVEQDKVAGIIGGTLSSEAIAVASASQGVGTPILSPSATALEFTSQGDNIFRGCFTDPIQARAMADFAVKTLGAKTVAILYDNSSDYSTGLTENFVEEFETLGGTVVANESYTAGDKDFNTQLTKIAAQDIDVFYVPNYYNDIALIAKQAKALGIEATLLGGDGWDGVLTVATPSDVEGAIFCNHYAPDGAGIQEFADKYKAAYGVEPNAFAYLSYDCTKLMVQAIDEAQSTDPQAVVEALYNIDYTGILGHMTFDENGDPIKDLAYITIQDGQYATYGQ